MTLGNWNGFNCQCNSLTFFFSANRGEEKDEEGGSDAEQARQHRNPQEHDDHDEGEGEDHDEGLGEDRDDDGDDNQSSS